MQEGENEIPHPYSFHLSQTFAKLVLSNMEPNVDPKTEREKWNQIARLIFFRNLTGTGENRPAGKFFSSGLGSEICSVLPRIPDLISH